MADEREPDSCQLILALDLETRREAVALLERLGHSIDWIKIGLRLFSACGPDLVHEIAARGHRVFLDLKLHDIPNTVAGAVQSIAGLPVELLTLHACGGAEMMRRAVRARDDNAPGLRLLAVTVLTSTDAEGLRETGVDHGPAEQVDRLAALALGAGIDGLVCSPLELPRLRGRFGTGPLLVTPGIRPAGAEVDDQKRVLGPGEAARAGVGFIVVGRPILCADDPAAAALAIRQEMLQGGN